MTSGADLVERARRLTHKPEARGVFVTWTLITIVLIAFAFVPAYVMGAPASPQMRAVETTIKVFTLVAAPVAAVVWAIALYSLVKWRYRGDGPPTEDGPAIRNDGLVTTIWMTVKIALCAFLVIWGIGALEAVANPANTTGAPLVVNVTGQQWVWTFSYPQDGNVQSDQLYLPKDRLVVFHVTSNDVVHSFWIVQMGVKVDANPGETTETKVQPDKLGRFDIRCAELCGLLHADMETSVHVVPPADFTSWLTAHGGHA